MSCWNYLYYLKTETNENDLWKCIKEITKGKIEFEYPENELESFYIKGKKEIISWSKRESLFEYKLLSEKHSLEITFNKQTTRVKNGEVHCLLYKEEFEEETEKFYEDFANSIRKFVPKVYATNTLSQELWNQPKKKLVDKSFIIKFYAGPDGKYFFDKKWIQKAADELWFLNTSFVMSDGAGSITRELILKECPDLRSMERRCGKSAMARRHLEEMIEIQMKMRMSNLSEFEKRTRIEFVFKGRRNIYFDKYIFEDFNSFKKLIIKVISESSDFNSELKEQIEKLFPKQENDSEIEELAHRKLEAYLTKNNLDAHFIEKIQKENEKLREEKNSLERELEDSKQEFEIKIAKLNGIIQNSKVPQKTDSVSNPIYEERISELEKQIKELEIEKNSLIKRNSELENNLTQRQNENNKGLYLLKIPCEEENLFPNEIDDYLYSLLYSKLDEEKNALPQNKNDEVLRRRDVIEKLLEAKNFDKRKTETNRKYERIDTILRDSRRPSLSTLAQEGLFEVEDTKNHPKCYFYNKKYQTVFSLTPSDKRVADNKMKELKERIFLIVD